MLMVQKKKIKVFIVGGGHAYISMMFTLGYYGVQTVEEADIVLFTGGSDVNPELYGEKCLSKTHFDRFRDDYEIDVYNRARALSIPMVGICRGGQFLNVMNGGKMFQHVAGHCGEHDAFTVPHNKKDKVLKIRVTSTHHQMMIPADKKESIILLVAHESTERYTEQRTELGKTKEPEDVEVVMYTDTDCLCFQPHPEFPSCPGECVDFFDECLDNWIVPMISLKKGQ